MSVDAVAWSFFVLLKGAALREQATTTREKEKKRACWELLTHWHWVVPKSPLLWRGRGGEAVKPHNMGSTRKCRVVLLQDTHTHTYMHGKHPIPVFDNGGM